VDCDHYKFITYAVEKITHTKSKQ